jgi:GNAT superfamily N-acetyltransferase
MTIRLATRNDLPTIAELIRELAEYEKLAHEVEWSDPEALAEHLFGPVPAAHVHLAETDDGDVAGMALWFSTFSTFVGRPGIWLEDLYVRPAFRGHGYGKALLTTLMDLSPGRVEWTVLDWNQSSIDFYDSLGATPVPGWTKYRWIADGAADAG